MTYKRHIVFYSFQNIKVVFIPDSYCKVTKQVVIFWPFVGSSRKAGSLPVFAGFVPVAHENYSTKDYARDQHHT